MPISSRIASRPCNDSRCLCPAWNGCENYRSFALRGIQVMSIIFVRQFSCVLLAELAADWAIGCGEAADVAVYEVEGVWVVLGFV